MAVNAPALLGTTALPTTADSIATSATTDSSQSSLFQLPAADTPVTTTQSPDASDDETPDTNTSAIVADDDNDTPDDSDDTSDAVADQALTLSSQQPSPLQYLLQDPVVSSPVSDTDAIPAPAADVMPATQNPAPADQTVTIPTFELPTATEDPELATTTAMVSAPTTLMASTPATATATDVINSSLTEPATMSMTLPVVPHKTATVLSTANTAPTDATLASILMPLTSKQTTSSQPTTQTTTSAAVATTSLVNALTTLTAASSDTGNSIDSDPYAALSSLSGSSSASQLSQWLNSHAAADNSSNKTASGQTHTNTQSTSATGNTFMYSQTNYTMSADLASGTTTENTMQAAGEKMLNLLQQQVSLQLTQQTQQATIRLDPPHLGQLDIVVKTEGDKLTVQINAEHAAVRESLENSREQLRQVLMPDHQGGVDVEIGQGSSSAQQQQQTIELWDDESISTASTMSSATGDTSDSIPESTTSNSDWLNTVV